MPFKIEIIRAYVAEDEKGEEGIVAAQMGGVMMPLICADKVRFEQMRPVAQQIARASGKNIKIIQFTRRIVLGDLETGEV